MRTLATDAIENEKEQVTERVGSGEFPPGSRPQASPQTVAIEGDSVPIHPVTKRPWPGYIVNQGKKGAHKIPWTQRDIEEIYGVVELYNYTGASSACVNGVRFSFPSQGMIKIPGIVWAVIHDSWEKKSKMGRLVRGSNMEISAGPWIQDSEV